MLLGTFNETGDGAFLGSIKTVFFEVAKVVAEPIVKTDPAQPDCRLYTGDDIEFGAAWKRTAKESGNIYYDVQIDDITFAEPRWARLVKKGERWLLLWERRPQRPA